MTLNCARYKTTVNRFVIQNMYMLCIVQFVKGYNSTTVKVTQLDSSGKGKLKVENGNEKAEIFHFARALL